MTNPEPDPAAPPPAPSPRVIRPGDLLVLVGAAMVVGFSFAPFVRYSDDAEQAFVIELLGIQPWFDAWSLETFMVPLTTFVVLAALFSIAAVVVRFGLRGDPAAAGFRLRQVEVGLALFPVPVLLGMVASSKNALFGARRIAEADPTFEASELALVSGWGAALMLAGAVLATVGAVLNHFAVGPTLRLGGARQAEPADRSADQPPQPPEPTGG